MVFSITVLGSNSAIPAHGRYPSAQVLNIREHHFLIDCGEGTQMRMNEYRIKRSKINQIFISHLHGDHVYGLVGLLTSYNLMGRETALDVYSPPGLEEVMDKTLEMSGTEISYPLHFHVLDTSNERKIFENNDLKVYSFPLEHRVPTCGFRFEEKPAPLNIIPEKIAEFNIPFTSIPGIKDGNDLSLSDGTIIPNNELTLPPTPPRKFAYCSDTSYTPSIVSHIKGVDLLYHEATFLKDLSDHSQLAKHSTAEQAATIAKMAEVKKLMLGHYSSRYKNLQPLLEEAKSVFSNTILGTEGLVVDIPQVLA
jgi:ribonuclease Z